jgi:hypothetical protein
MQQNAAPVFVYVVTDTEQRFCKIGISDRPDNRLSELQVGCPFPLHIAHQFAAPSRAAALALEGAAHRALAADSATGEWFNVTPTRAYVTIAELMRGAVLIPSDVSRADLATRSPHRPRKGRKHHPGSLFVACRCGHTRHVWHAKPGVRLRCTKCDRVQKIPEIRG